MTHVKIRIRGLWSKFGQDDLNFVSLAGSKKWRFFLNEKG